MARAVPTPTTSAKTAGELAPVAAVVQHKTAMESQWRLTWRKFRKHKVALIAGVVLIGFYTVVLFADFFAYADPLASEAQRGLLPPQGCARSDHLQARVRS